MDKTEKSLLDSLHKDIIAALYIGQRSVDVTEVVRAYDAGHIPLMQLFARLLPDSSVRFSDARSLYLALKSQGFDEAEHLVTPKRVTALACLWDMLTDLKQEHPEMDIRAALCFIVMSDERDRELAELIVKERWSGSLRNAQELLVEMKLAPLSLSSGSL